MKKIFTLTVTMLLLALFVTVFVGCDKKEEKEEDGQTAYINFDDIVSDKISEEEYDMIKQNATSEDNFRVLSKYSGTEEIFELQEMIDMTTTVDINGNVTKATMRVDYKNGKTFYLSHLYMEMEGEFGTDAWESEDNIHWSKTEGASAEVYRNFYSITCIGMPNYDYLVWDDEKKGYVVETEVAYSIYKFQDNRVVGYYSVFDDEGDSKIQTFVFYDFGKVKEIERPQGIQEDQE